jgi:hypothetical protein
MYWSRTGSPIEILIFLIQCLAWTAGGWLWVTHAFRLHPSERLLAGLAVGLLMFITLSNLLAHFLLLPAALWGAALLVLLSGIGLAWARRVRQPGLPWLDKADLRAWPRLAALLGLTLLFTLIGRGLAIFDEDVHLPLISVMAAGDIPPHFYLDPSRWLAYHYGLHVFAAALVRLGGFFPWSAWDLSKALSIALTLTLAWSWIMRQTRSRLAAWLSALLVVLCGGARWVLLLAPPSVLLWISNGIQLTNTATGSGPDLFMVLSRPWLIEGSGPFPFPFAYHNGIFVPVVFALGASSAMLYFTVILLLILVNRRHLSMAAIIPLSLIFASLALSGEHLFVFLWAGLALAGLSHVVLRHMRSLHRQPIDGPALVPWAAILAVSAILSLIQGGFLTEALRNLLAGLKGTHTVVGTYNYFTFVPRWPPALDTAHFGALSLLDPRQLLALLAELGPALLLAPMATRVAWRGLFRGRWLAAGLGLAALASFVIPLFFQYGVERSGTRLPATALWLWMLLAIPPLWRALARKGGLARKNGLARNTGLWPLLAGLGYVTASFGGLVIFAVQLMAIPYPQLTYYINGKDAVLGQELWDRLPQNAQVYDVIPFRSVALFGRPARTNQDFYHSWPDFLALAADPDPVSIRQAGFSYVFVERKWWESLRPRIQRRFEAPCVQRAAEYSPGDGDFRWLLDIRACQ